MLLHYTIEGQGPDLFLGHALGCDLSMWKDVSALLRKDFRVVCFDQLGHGRSPLISGTPDIAKFTDSVVALMASLGVECCLYAGISMGAMVSIDLASRYPALCRGIVLANTAYHYEAQARSAWEQRIDTVNHHGIEAVASMVIARWLTPEFFKTSPEKIALLKDVLLRTDANSYSASCHAVASIDFREILQAIDVPALVIAGRYDLATPPEFSEYLHRVLDGSRIEYLQAAHISAVEKPLEFSIAIRDFFSRLP
jgi:3-oxoadipate enol-lactonase